MTHRTFTLRLSAIMAAAGLLILGIGYGTAHAAAGGKSVELSAASIEPDYLAYVPSDGRATPKRAIRDYYGRPCRNPDTGRRGYFSDVQAYRWDGGALAGQQWDGTRLLYSWADTREGGRVTYDGITFRNHTARPVLVAGWCG